MGSSMHLQWTIVLVTLSLAASGCQMQQLAPAMPSRWGTSAATDSRTGADAEFPRGELMTSLEAQRPIDPIVQKNGLLVAQAHLVEVDGNTDGAIQAYQEILANDSKNLYAMHRLAVLLAARGDLKTAELTFQNALMVAPGNAAIHSDLG
jgi:Flp pilus assembly protein TadD